MVNPNKQKKINAKLLTYKIEKKNNLKYPND